MPKGMSWDKAMSNSEKIKSIALAIIELRLSESINQLVSQSVSQGNLYFTWWVGKTGLKASEPMIDLP